jgi:hypothetical protein
MLLAISGWLIVMAALILLRATEQRLAFVFAALGVEVLGLALLTQGYKDGLGLRPEAESTAPPGSRG